jgi:hypothetical protein
LYPLIYSSGPDKCSGIFGNPGPTFHVSDSTTRLNTASVHALTTTPPLATDAMIGCAVNDPAEPNFNPNPWADNIHNHMISLR